MNTRDISLFFKNYASTMAQPLLYTLPELVEAYALTQIVKILASTNETNDESMGLLIACFQITITAAQAGMNAIGLELAEQYGESSSTEIDLRALGESEATSKYSEMTYTINKSIAVVVLYLIFIASLAYNAEAILILMAIRKESAGFVANYLQAYLWAVFPQLLIQSYYKLNAAINQKTYNLIYMLAKCLLDVGVNYFLGVHLKLRAHYCAYGSAATYALFVILARTCLHRFEVYAPYQLHKVGNAWSALKGYESYYDVGYAILNFTKDALLLFSKAFTFTILAICGFISGLIMAGIINKSFSRDIQVSYTLMVSAMSFFLGIQVSLSTGQGLELSKSIGRLKYIEQIQLPDVIKAIHQQRFYYYLSFFILAGLATTMMATPSGSSFLIQQFLPANHRPYTIAKETLGWAAAETPLIMLFNLLSLTFLSAIKQYPIPTALNLLFVTVGASLYSLNYADIFGVSAVYGPQITSFLLMNALLLAISIIMYREENLAKRKYVHSPTKGGHFAFYKRALHASVHGYSPINAATPQENDGPREFWPAPPGIE